MYKLEYLIFLLFLQTISVYSFVSKYAFNNIKLTLTTNVILSQLVFTILLIIYNFILVNIPVENLKVLSVDFEYLKIMIIYTTVKIVITLIMFFVREDQINKNGTIALYNVNLTLGIENFIYTSLFILLIYERI